MIGVVEVHVLVPVEIVARDNEKILEQEFQDDKNQQQDGSLVHKCL